MQNKKILINPQDWVLKDGILVPKSTLLPKFETPKLDRDVFAYATFGLLFPKEENSLSIIKKEFKNYYIQDIIQVLAKINYIISSIYYKPDLQELNFLKQFLEDEQIEIINKQKDKIKLVSRQQVLANIRLALLYSVDNPKAKTVYGNEKEFGKLFFRITDFMEDTFEDEDLESLKNWPGKKKLYISLARNLVFNEATTFASSLARYWFIFNKIAYNKTNRSFKLKSLYRSSVGTNFNYLFAVGFSIWGFYSKPNQQKRLSQPHEFLFNSNYFRKANKRARVKLLKALENLSDNSEFFHKEFKKMNQKGGEYFAFNIIWRKPIFKTEVGAYYALDLKYLEDRLTFGAFWFIFDKAKSDEERSNLRGKWGNIFESYVNYLFKETYKAKEKVVYFELDGDINCGVDIILYYPDVLFLIEVTTRQIKHNSWTSGKAEEIETDLKKLLLGKTDNSKGRVTKLYEALEKIKSGETKIPGIDIAKIKKFIPVVLFEKTLPMHNKIWEFYSHFLEENGIKDRNFLAELEFWDIEEMEMLLADVVSGKALPDILKEKEDSGYYKDSVRNFYIIKRKDFSKHPVTKEAFDLMADNAKAILFQKKE